MRPAGRLLVAADIGDLFVVTQSLEIIRIGDIAIARVKLDKTVEAKNGVIVLAAGVERIRAQ